MRLRSPGTLLLAAALLQALAGAACEEPGVGRAFVWRPGGLVLRAAPAIKADRLAKVDYGQQVRLRSRQLEGEPALLDGVGGRWLPVRLADREGYLFAGYLARLAPPASCESFANYLANLEANEERAAAPEKESFPLRLPAPDSPEGIPAVKHRRTTRFENGMTVVDEESPQFASIAITIEDFPLAAAFQLAQACNPNFFAGLAFPRRSLRRLRRGDADPENVVFLRSIDSARYSPSGSPMLFENKTETDSHLEKTTVQELAGGAVRIKYYYGSLE